MHALPAADGRYRPRHGRGVTLATSRRRRGVHLQRAGGSRPPATRGRRRGPQRRIPGDGHRTRSTHRSSSQDRDGHGVPKSAGGESREALTVIGATGSSGPQSPRLLPGASTRHVDPASRGWAYLFRSMCDMGPGSFGAVGSRVPVRACPGAVSLSPCSDHMGDIISCRVYRGEPGSMRDSAHVLFEPGGRSAVCVRSRVRLR